MEDQYGRVIGVVDDLRSISRPEKQYVAAMSKEAKAYHETVVALAQALNLDNDDIIPDLTLHKFRELITTHKGLAERLAAWSANNLEMSRFPADYYELENAKGLAVQGKQKSGKLRNGYRMILGTMTTFHQFPDQQETITAIGRAVDKLHVLILDAQASVAEDKYTVDLKFLDNLTLIEG